MQIFSSPELVETPETLSAVDLLIRRVEADPTREVLEVWDGQAWQPMSGEEFLARIMKVARGLIGAGIEAGDRVAILSRTRYEWSLLDFAIWSVGAVPVPIYETSSPDQINWIAQDSGSRAIVVEQQRHADAVRESGAAAAAQMWVIDDGGLDELAQAGAQVTEQDVIARREKLTGADLATIIYTSGTTGRPKGAEITHANLAGLSSQVIAVLPTITMDPHARYLCFMPLAHVYARLVEVAAFGSRIVTAFTPDTKNLMADMESFRPTLLLVVPRVFEKVYNSAELKAGSGFKLRMFRWAAKVAIVYSRRLDTAAGPGLRLSFFHKLASLLVYRKLHHAMGGHLKYCVSGGAPLGDRLGHFFRGIGITVLEGYGLTETTAPSNVNRLEHIKIGTVGPPLPGTTVRIAEGGEIQVKGPGVFRGYHGNPEATKEAFVDGFFRTGDLGSIDEDGNLSITGRLKEIIVTAGGKNVAPAVLEDRLRGHPLVSQCVVVGDGKPFIGVLITLDAEMLPGWLANHGRPALNVHDAANDPVVLKSLQGAVDRANRVVSRAESIRKFRILDTDFTEANGYLTPSLKVKRSLVLHDFAADIDALYEGVKTGGPSADEDATV